MKPRARPLKDLYFRFGVHHGLNWQDVALALYDGGFIDLEVDKYSPVFSHYRDTESLRHVLKAEDPNTVLSQIFSNFKAHRGLAR